MESIAVADLPDVAGVAVELVGRTAAPLGPFVVDLDSVDTTTAVAVSEQLLGRSVPLLIGRSSRPLREDLAPLLVRLTLTIAPSGPGATWVAAEEDGLDDIGATVAAAPVAASVLAGVLAAGEGLPVPAALALESAAYSMLLASDEFLRWRANSPANPVDARPGQVAVHRDADVLHVELDRPERHNAFGHVMRDQLLEALSVAELDETVTIIRVTGRGPSFCSGGDLAEFGTAGAPALAHLLRLQQSAGLAFHRLRDRVKPVLHGACVGAGIEVPAFAANVAARDGAWFQLPEVAFGLIPGAGGTVSIPRRIGRWRTAFLALSGRRLDMHDALAWGLVDARA